MQKSTHRIESAALIQGIVRSGHHSDFKSSYNQCITKRTKDDYKELLHAVYVIVNESQINKYDYIDYIILLLPKNKKCSVTFNNDTYVSCTDDNGHLFLWKWRNIYGFISGLSHLKIIIDDNEVINYHMYMRYVVLDIQQSAQLLYLTYSRMTLKVKANQRTILPKKLITKIEIKKGAMVSILCHIFFIMEKLICIEGFFEFENGLDIKTDQVYLETDNDEDVHIIYLDI